MFKRVNCIPALLVLSVLSACGGGGSGTATAPAPVQSTPPPTQLSVAESVDALVKPYMSANSVSAATISVMKDGVVLYEHGYGFQDAAQTTALPANALFRTASLVKPVTAAAIQNLATQGKLALSDHAFCVGNNQPCWLPETLLSASTDARVKDITLRQLLGHQGGWDRTISEDPASTEAKIRDALGKTVPVNREDIIRYVMAKPLDFTPGSRTAYSNMGYLLLGQVIELASKTDLMQYLQSTIMLPIGVNTEDFKQAHTLLTQRDPREPNYLSTLMIPSAFTPGKIALAMDEGALAENWTASGGAIATAHAMATFAANYRLPDGVALAGARNDGFKDGDAPGTTSALRQLPSGITYAVYMNASVAFNIEQGSFLKQLDAAIAASK